MLKIVRWVIVAMVGVIILAVIALQFPAVQGAIVRQLVASVTAKTHSRIEVGAVRIAFTHSVVLEDVFIESLQRDTLLHIRTLAADINLLDLLSNEITLRHLRIDSLTAHISRAAPDSIFNFEFLLEALSPDGPAVRSSPEPAWKFDLDQLKLNGIHVTYNDEKDGLDLRLDLGTLGASIDRFDLDNRQFHIDDMALENATVSLIQTSDKQGATKIYGIDPDHLRIDDLSLRAGNIVISDARMAAVIQRTSFRERGGLEVRELSGTFVVDSVHAQLTDVTLVTATSRFHQDLLLTYTSFADLLKSPGTVGVSASMSESHIAVSDLLELMPTLPLKRTSDATIRCTFALSGKVRDLQVEHFRLGVGDATTIELTGALRGLPDVDKASYDIELLELSSGRHDIQALVADSSLPVNLVLPASMHLSGNFHGTLSNFSAGATLESSIGGLKAHVAFSTAGGDNGHTPRWQAEVHAMQFNPGALFDDLESLGPVTMTGTAAGTGLHMPDIEARVDLEVSTMEFNRVAMQRLSIHGTAGSQMFTGKAAMDDSSLAFTFDGTVNTSKERPAYKFTLNVKGADLQRLRLTTDDVRVAGLLSADLTGSTVDDINGTAGVHHVTVLKNRKRFRLDSLTVTATNTDNGSHIRVESPIMTGAFDGTISPGDLPAVLTHHVGRYFTLHEPPLPTVSRPQAFSFSLSLRDPAMLTDVLFPQLEGLGPGVLTGTYNSEDMLLHLHADVSAVSYAGLDMDSLSLEVMSDVRQMRSAFRIASIENDVVRLTDLRFSAIAEVDSITMSLQSADGKGATQMSIAGSWTSVPDGFQFRFRPDGVVFQDTVWHVPPDNYVLFRSGAIIAHHVALRGGAQSLSVNAPDTHLPFPPLQINFAHWDLATFSRVVERDSGLVRGVVDGSIVLHGAGDELAFTSDLTVKRFAFAQHQVGDVVLRAHNRSVDSYEVTADIAGNENDVGIRGSYRNTEGPNALDLVVEFRKGNLASFEPLTFGSIQRLSGSMSGAVHVTGTLRNPSVAGDLKFTHATLSPTILGSLLHVNDGRITFDARGMHIGSVKLTDTLGHEAVLSGSLLTDDYRDFGFDLRLHTERFLVMNTTARRDVPYYGIIFLDSDIVIGGDVAKPVIHVQAHVGKGTDLAIVLPASEIDLEQRSGIVRFVDVRHPADPIMSRRKPGNTGTRTFSRERVSGVALTSNIEVDKEARVRILIDPTAGDSLVIRGQGTFSAGMEPGGPFVITGRYEILDGSYQLSFGELIRREFVIDKGSSLTWSGSVTDAAINIAAIYTVKASALDLVRDQLTGLSEEERNKFKQEYPIQVYLMMDGKLLEPNIRLRLDLSPNQRGALGGALYAKLIELNGQESELSKQVFALLVLGRFIPSNPLASSSNGDGLTGFARSSVSQILSQQLDRLSANMITGISLDVGVESYQDYSSGTPGGRTQLQLGLTKQLFDERVTVQIGGNVDLEGERSRHNSLNSFAGDIRVGYKMTEDGRWQLLVFRNNTNGDALEGDLVETGVGIVFTIDYDKLFGITLTPVRANEAEK
jgi:hypothetical protein